MNKEKSEQKRLNLMIVDIVCSFISSNLSSFDLCVCYCCMCVVVAVHIYTVTSICVYLFSINKPATARYKV